MVFIYIHSNKQCLTRITYWYWYNNQCQITLIIVPTILIHLHIIIFNRLKKGKIKPTSYMFQAKLKFNIPQQIMYSQTFYLINSFVGKHLV